MFRPSTKEPSFPHFPLVAAGSIVLIAVVVAIYAYFASSDLVLSPEVAAALALPAYVYLVVLIVGMVATLVDLRIYLKRRAAVLAGQGAIPLSPSSIGPYILSQRRYWLVFVGSAALYGLLYAFLTSLFVYRGDISFAAFPGLPIPSVQPDLLTGAPLYVPEVTVFLTDHFALVVVPLTLILLVAISVLVGFNSALAAFAYDNRVKGGGNTWAGQLGAAVGLFTGCPTCAGLYFFSLVGGSGAVSAAVVLGYYQPVFVALSIPVLLLTPYLISRSLAKVFRDGCVVPRPGHQRP